MGAETPRDSTAFEVREALEEPGCVVCRLAVRSVGRWLSAVAYDQINDVELRTELRDARGFCNAHAHRWLREARNTLGTAIVYRDLLRAGLRTLDNGGGSQSGRGRWRGILGGGGAAKCPACSAQKEAEGRYLAALLATAASDPGALTRSDGLCLRHARAAARRGGAGADRAVEQTRAAIARLLAELDEVIRKEDYRFRHEERTDAERAAPGRAVARAAGADGLVETT
jgi:hypothetical protein